MKGAVRYLQDDGTGSFAAGAEEQRGEEKERQERRGRVGSSSFHSGELLPGVSFSIRRVAVAVPVMGVGPVAVVVDQLLVGVLVTVGLRERSDMGMAVVPVAVRVRVGVDGAGMAVGMSMPFRAEEEGPAEHQHPRRGGRPADPVAEEDDRG
jgi:hypothetical protein